MLINSEKRSGICFSQRRIGNRRNSGGGCDRGIFEDY
jgi:hypothetical protein